MVYLAAHLSRYSGRKKTFHSDVMYYVSSNYESKPAHVTCAYKKEQEFLNAKSDNRQGLFKR